ncbi:hypothetical protein PP175_25245 (plasmid) [Aneurinibacillus sp. Ricciae_BoGa-3]|uniref:hypothetical protein n=1 Tax=Aneurinibacillus sp. Ricciae_BoGa-3 TaxID=3022697 RepID=UPI00234056D9|nr:hypothetical protein [Aneurinibacillus sp. Ricciae_BoGa-3]WCK57375.1 hypothetical protein PP175_25245 [Aneurinibacillus sp. Ricciae_BoGa-3]
MLKNGLVQAYVLDGKSVVALPKTDVTFDATTNQVTIFHDALKHYTQQSIVLTAGETDLEKTVNGLAGKLKLALPVMDVVTAVDDNAKTVTLLNGGVISYASAFDKEVKGLQWKGQHEDWQRGESQGIWKKQKAL